MRKLAACLSLLFLVPAFAVSTSAQEAHKAPANVKVPSGPAHFYRLDFVLVELDAAGKAVNSRSFTTTVSNDVVHERNSITVGSRVPILTGVPAHTAEDSKRDVQFQYIDVGIRIFANNVQEDGNRLTFNLTATVSSITTPTVLAGVSEPVIRNNVWDGEVLIPIGKPTVAFKSDSLDSKGSMQLLVTASRLD